MNRLTYAYKLTVNISPFNMSWETIKVRPYTLRYFLHLRINNSINVHFLLGNFCIEDRFIK